MGETTSITNDLLAGRVGKLALERGLITPAQLQEVRLERSFAAAAGHRGDGLLGALLVYKGYLTVELVETLISEVVREEKEAAARELSSPEGPASERPTLGAFGRYTLLRVLGRGGMGIVYEARDRSLGRSVALKIISHRKVDPETNASPDTQRFVKEARLSANLPKHPNIAGVYDAGVLEGKWYITMELISGRSMEKWRSEGNAPLREQVRVLRDAALGLHHAHEQGIVHRDLKPTNILVDGDGKAVITDFGVAKSVTSANATSLTPDGLVVGSPEYMSPEQASGGKTVDRRSDVYALGVILYEILTGRRPFGGKNPLEILLRVSEGTAAPPMDLAKAESLPPVDATLNQICLKAIQKHPDKRHPSAREFAEDLTRWLDGSKPVKRRLSSVIPVALTALILATLGAALLLTMSLISSSPTVEEEEFPAARRIVLVEMTNFKPKGSIAHKIDEQGRVHLYNSGTMETVVPIPVAGVYEIVVDASCDVAAGEFARFRVFVDGEDLGETALTTEQSAPYRVEATLPAGDIRLGIRFTNDLDDKAKGEDRNLYLNDIELRKVR